jgi:hypothetical protein
MQWRVNWVEGNLSKLFFICLVDGDSYAKSEDLHHIKRFDHGNVYVKRGLDFKKKAIHGHRGSGFFNKKTNTGLLFLLKVRSSVFISNFLHSPPPPPKWYKTVSLIINLTRSYIIRLFSVLQKHNMLLFIR